MLPTPGAIGHDYGPDDGAPDDYRAGYRNAGDQPLHEIRQVGNIWVDPNVKGFWHGDVSMGGVGVLYTRACSLLQHRYSGLHTPGCR